MNLKSMIERFSQYETILEPDENTPEWWAGAPSVVRAPDGAFYLAARMREGNSPRGMRGYEVRILRSEDGRRFEVINQITREAANVPGFERPALVIDPKTGKFRLYGCAGLDAGWSILKWDDVADPADFKASTVRPVLQAPPRHERFAQVEGYKDQVIMWHAGAWHMFTIGYDRIERIHHFVSADGVDWEYAQPYPVMENSGWHNYYTRPASILPLHVGYLFVYEGSDINWRDPCYNIATGLAYTLDLEHLVDLTPDRPLFKSTTPGDYHTWRYSHWLRVEDKVYVYFEACRPNNTNEIRLTILDADFAG